MMDLIKTIEEQQKTEGALNFSVGDTVKVHFEIIEGKTKRIQVYEGVVIAIKNTGVRKTFTVRKISYGVGVERVFPVYSPRVVRVDVVRVGKVRRSKLYYIRDKVGKAAKVKELLGAQATAYLERSRAATQAKIAAEQARKAAAESAGQNEAEAK
ncbi:MAG: 50S ribosomal protein L19 [Treponemataceae bacterium]|nr:50S ribosomal protein L19 [Treponemataceae bacterium]MDE6704969.1 50S ribosomal protein L19 [Treponemataceae bacterium]